MLIFDGSKPPSLKILGLPTREIIVDSKPIDDLPPSNTNLILFPNSFLISLEHTQLTLEEILALGAAKGYLNIFKSFFVSVCFGNLIASVFFFFSY